MVTNFEIDDMQTVYTRSNPSIIIFFALFGGMISLIFAIGAFFVKSVPEYLFKVGVIQSLFRFKSAQDIL